jgi:hypothetical protein
MFFTNYFMWKIVIVQWQLVVAKTFRGQLFVNYRILMVTSHYNHTPKVVKI